jgi:hypothetical protein
MRRHGGNASILRTNFQSLLLRNELGLEQSASLGMLPLRFDCLLDVSLFANVGVWSATTSVTCQTIRNC